MTVVVRALHVIVYESIFPYSWSGSFGESQLTIKLLEHGLWTEILTGGPVWRNYEEHNVQPSLFGKVLNHIPRQLTWSVVKTYWGLQPQAKEPSLLIQSCSHTSASAVSHSLMSIAKVSYNTMLQYYILSVDFNTSACIAIGIQCISNLTITSIWAVQIFTHLHTIVDAQETLINFCNSKMNNNMIPSSNDVLITITVVAVNIQSISMPAVANVWAYCVDTDLITFGNSCNTLIQIYNQF